MSDDTLRHADDWTGPRPEGPGSVIGLYTLRQRIGEGGFGDVWQAEQFEPVHRKVALKILKQGMDTREVIARFELERQALAVMEHPHIARVFDAGATTAGRPYFVMEYVEGEPITSYCDHRAMALDDRLQLFVQVCAAVQHAHTKGVVHRDLKPGNVLVGEHEGKPYAKVIDFGIAKAVSGELSEHTHATRMGQVMGTPRYMSPEQASGSADIDTRTDVYSLGVILYELLTGSTPVERSRIESASIAETQRLICEVEPPSPSARLRKSSTTGTVTAGFHNQQALTLARQVRGELDWIAMKALDKDRSRRYETANALAADVQRHLDGLPVLAAPPSRAYRAGKFIRRHTVGVAAAALVTISLLAGIVAFAWQAKIARQQERLAQQRAEQIEQIADFQSAMLGKIDPVLLGKTLTDDVHARLAQALTTARLPDAERKAQIAAFTAQWEQLNATDVATALIDQTVLTPAITQIDQKFARQPLVDAALRQALADSYATLGLLDKAMALQKKALATRRHLLGSAATDTLASMQTMGILLNQQGNSDAAEPLFRELLATRRKRLGDTAPDTLAAMESLGETLDYEGKFAQAESMLRQAYEQRRRLLGADDKDTLTSMQALGGVYLDQGKSELGRAMLADALARGRRVWGEDDPQTMNAINDLGVAWMSAGQPARAEPLFREAWQKHRTLQGENHPDTVQSQANLGGILMTEGKASEAEPLLRDAIARSRRVLGADNATTLLALASLGKVLLDQGKAEEVTGLLAPALADAKKNLAEASPPQFGFFMLVLGMAQASQHDYAAAEASLLGADASFARATGPRYGTYPKMCVRALAQLYPAWDKADPGHGHAAKGKHWQQLLATLEATSATPSAKK